MNIEEAVEIQKNIRQKILDGKRIRECTYPYWQIEQSIEIILNELDKKDKVIDMMAEWLYGDDTSFGYGKLKETNTPEKIKEYFCNKIGGEK